MSGYDENLLKDAPEASRAERQKGYNIDLLAPDRVQSPPADPPRTPSAPPGPSFPPGAGDPEAATGTNGPGAKEYGSISQEEDGGAPRRDAKPVSFWRTTKGKLLIGLIALIVIGAIVGGAVGGATSSKGGSKAVNPSTTSSPGPISSSSSTPNNSAGGTGTKGQPVDSSTTTSSSTRVGSGSGPTSGNDGQGPGGSTPTSTPTPTATSTTTSPTTSGPGIPGMAFGEGGAVADSSQDRRRHPSPARGVAGAEVDH